MRGRDVARLFEKDTLNYEQALRAVDRDLSSEKGYKLQKEHAVSGLYMKIAHLHLPMAADYDTRLKSLLERRERDAEAQAQALAQLEGRIAAQTLEVDACSETVFECQERVNTRLSEDDDYTQVIAEIKNTQAALSSLSQDGEEIRREVREKLPAYTGNPAYQYLLDRRFGTPEYHAGRVTRWLDAWVARRCNFIENHRQHVLLSQMQDALGVRVQRIGATLEQLEKLERTLRLVVEKDQGLIALNERLEKLQDTLTAMKNEARRIGLQLQAFAQGEDEDARHVREAIVKALRKASFETLRARVRETQTDEDDRMLEQIDRLQAEIVQHAERIEALSDKRRVAEENRDRAKRIERRLRDRMVSNERYRIDSGFNTNDLIQGYVLGRLSESDVFRETDRNIRRAPEQSSYSSSSSFGGSSSSSGFSSSGSFGGGGSYSTSDSF